MKEDMPFKYFDLSNDGRQITLFRGLVYELFKVERNPPKIKKLKDKSLKIFNQ